MLRLCCSPRQINHETDLSWIDGSWCKAPFCETSSFPESYFCQMSRVVEVTCSTLLSIKLLERRKTVFFVCQNQPCHSQCAILLLHCVYFPFLVEINTHRNCIFIWFMAFSVGKTFRPPLKHVAKNQDADQTHTESLFLSPPPQSLLRT